MSTRALADTNEEVTRIAGGQAPPLAERVFQGQTRITGIWTHGAYSVDVAPMEQHIVAAIHGGSGVSASRIDGVRSQATIRGGTYTILPRGHYGPWEITGGQTVSNVFLGHGRLLGFAEQLAEGRSFELLDQVQGDNPRLFAIMDLLRHEAAAPGPYGELYVEQALDLLCFELLRTHSTLCARSTQRQHGLAAWQVKRVLAYMREHQGMEVTLQELADIVHMSRYHFCAAFRNATGLTPFGYLTRLRMETAYDLLRNSPLTIADIALAVGYGNAAAFSTAFRRYCGLSPRQYRSRNYH
ncbi:AraC family transcriptional regulator [Pseudoxanthomonas sp. F37]|uniref:helix-turn-helix transcriptional regulator n=1 Tax=Pseudoxanthomonas TaxID=83618 RepID=UPI001FD2B8DF|nr:MULTISPECIES: AraC family transcriptional regulator [Pseudoxanthomonas]UOV05558.1 AraC family transcriptional regulator [Pseudoxanthomonas mexicana]UOV07116.1 AraC family transcriptional regulator [Pseudoxanthomonas sp. F37]